MLRFEDIVVLIEVLPIKEEVRNFLVEELHYFYRNSVRPKDMQKERKKTAGS